MSLLGGLASCELDSGREHLRDRPHHGVVAFIDPAWGRLLVLAGLVFVVVVFVECLCDKL